MPDIKAREILTIPPGVPFADSLADGLLERFAGDPMALAAVQVLLPTRRACRALADAFLRRSAGKALLLPAMTPIGDLDDDSFALLEGAGFGAGDPREIPPAVPEMRRRLMLTRLILGKADADGDSRPSPAQAAELAAELARLLDQVQTERLDFDGLAGLVPDDYARHWQITLDFLKIVTEAWPAVLAEDGCIDPADRRNRAIAARIETWRATPPDTPVIAAGSTGTIPATADLIEAVASLPQGMVILPGLDTALDDDAADQLGPTHPQFGMVALVRRLGLAPSEVTEWHVGEQPGHRRARAGLIADAMHPATTTPVALDPKLVAEAVAGVRRVDCPGPRDEAVVIALMLREALETDGKTAALVTPDRGLARRVAVEMRRWNIEIDDSAGRNLSETPPGVFLRLTASLAAESAAPVPLLAALKHPLAAAGTAPPAFRAMVRALERAVLRGPRPGAGFDGLAHALAHTEDADTLAPWLARLSEAAAPFMELMAAPAVPVGRLLTAHIRCAEALAATDAVSGADRLWAGDAGEAAARLVDEIAAGATIFGAIEGREWPALLDTLMADRAVRPSYGRHPRLNIWGPLEARLQHADLIVLGGLNEGSWPREPAADPWMSRPMREKFGLVPLERRVGLAAHDFAQAFAAEEVALTRSTRTEGTPTVPSRWLLRLDNTLKRAAIEGGLSGEQAKWLTWQGSLDTPLETIDIRAPAPCPPVALRPRRLSVTEIETLMRDPYAVYARRVLHLRALEPIDADPGAAERGTFIHRALDDFVREFPGDLSPDAMARLIELGERAFGAALDRPGVRAFWWPRFERIAAWFIEHERAFRLVVERVHSEVSGEITIVAPAGPFVLVAKADRVDEMQGGWISIADYKTGGVPGTGEIEHGFAPQLPLEAVIAEAGGFRDVPAGRVAELAYWKLSGGDPEGEIKPAGKDVAALIETARDGFARLIAGFDDPATPYLSQPDPARAPRYSDYTHLARVREWIAQSGE